MLLRVTVENPSQETFFASVCDQLNLTPNKIHSTYLSVSEKIFVKVVLFFYIVDQFKKRNAFDLVTKVYPDDGHTSYLTITKFYDKICAIDICGLYSKYYSKYCQLILSSHILIKDFLVFWREK